MNVIVQGQGHWL